ncbi:MAG: oxidoreductase [Pseudomonadota bacterium]
MNAEQKKICVGLVGFGFAGSTFHAPVIAAVDALQLVAVASSQAEAVHAAWPTVRVMPEASQLFADPDVDLVVIAAPNEAHFSLALAALSAGKHVVVDKPFTITSAEAAILIACARQNNRLLSVYHNRRWDADFLSLQDLLAQGTLGRIATFESHFDRFRPQIKQRWRELDSPGGGLLYDLGPHLIDQALVLFGMPSHLFADIALQRDGAAAVDYFHLVLYYAQMRVILHAGSLVNQVGPRFSVHGERGSFVKFGLDPQEDSLRAGGNPRDANWGQDAVSARLSLGSSAGAIDLPMRRGCYQNYYEGIATAITHGSPAPVSAEDGMRAIVLIETALRSAASGKVLELEPISASAHGL